MCPRYDVYDLSPGAKDDEPGMADMAKQGKSGTAALVNY